MTSDSLSDGVTIDQPIMTFPEGYMTRGYWAIADRRDATVPLPIFGTLSLYPLQSAIIAFNVKPGGLGTIAGAVDVETMRTTMIPGLASFGVCEGNAVFDQAADALKFSADLVSGAPSLQDPTKTCNAISLGIGFQVEPTGVPVAITRPLIHAGCR